MKSKVIILVLTLVLLVLIGIPTTVASWAKFNTSDLVQNSDVILLGKIVGPVEESQGVADGISGWVTYWRVEVFYYLKGDNETKDFYVVTPGAKNKTVSSANDYRLDEWGSTVVLFLRKDGDSYVPLSPQGVVTIEKIGYSPKADEPLNGKRILAEFNITNPQTNTKEDFERFILENSVPVIPTNVSANLPLNIRSGNVNNIYNNAIFSRILMGLLIISGLVIIVMLLLRHRSRVS
ncbi:hypothetical protein UF75_4201 [Desulfosporosinus sp. I2]|uniref:hypothetical protein n=1 Tax=Desulfosporosinus sp. I2 TaxID=1617025 RepID=UPI0005EEEEBB|nr:hypothetical protein [Desulfosporosinus sp. I2]KJR45414.1 hypothetical protein UF75_4201 [Desulfosporosinus sp. I2]